MGYMTIDGRKVEFTDEPNVLVLDYAKFRINDGEFSEKKEILLIDRCLRAEFGLEPRGGMMDQPWYTAQRKLQTKAEIETVFEFAVNRSDRRKRDGFRRHAEDYLLVFHEVM